MDIFRPVEHWADRAPEEIALQDDDGVLTWSALAAAARAECRRLEAAGVGAGDRVGVLMLNSRAFCVAVLGAFAAGAVAVPVNHRLGPREVADQLEDAGAGVLTYDAAHERTALAVAERLGVTVLCAPDLAAHEPGRASPRELDDVAVLLYSSGTTGRPRGVAVSHRNILAMAHDRIVNDAWGRHTCTYVPYPLAFSAGLLASWLATVVAGGRTVVDAAFDPGRALRHFEEDGITVFMAVPAVWQAIAAHPDLEHTDVSTLETVSAGGAMVTPELMRLLDRRGIRLSQGYGLTESSGVATALRPEDVLRKPGSIGKPMMMMEARVVGPDGADCAVDERGELWLRGPAVMSGYWTDNAPDRSGMPEGWLRTGDIVTRDGDGYLYVVDRLKDMIITGGINVVPAEIERALEEVPGVRESAVVGVPHARWGEASYAFVVADDETVTADSLESWLRERLAGFKVPKVIEVRTEPLPRSANGKVLRRSLRGEACAGWGDGAQEVESLIRRYFRSVDEEDWTALESVLHPEVEVRHGSLLHAKGASAVVGLYQTICRQYDLHRDEPTRIVVDGDHVAVDVTATVRLHEVEDLLTFPAFDVIELRDGRIAHVSTWYDTAEVVPRIRFGAGEVVT